MSATTANRNVNIYMEANPNPNSMKFVANFMLLADGQTFDYPEASAAGNSTLAQQLFELPYVKRVFYMSNFITVTKSEEVEWVEIRNDIKELIKNYLENNTSLITADTPEEQYDEKDSETVVKIKSILDEYIRPAVEMDGGAIQFHSFDAGTVRVLLQGSCSGCPSSAITLKAGIENLLKRMLPEVETVEAIDG